MTCLHCTLLNLTQPTGLSTTASVPGTHRRDLPFGTCTSTPGVCVRVYIEFNHVCEREFESDLVVWCGTLPDFLASPKVADTA